MSPALLALLAGCPRPAAAPPPQAEAEREEAVVEPPPCGQLRDGRYTDAGRGFSIEVPEDWLITPCRGDADQRLTMSQGLTGVSLSVAVYAEDHIAPRERAGCLWTFQDTGHYSALAAPEVTVAGCTPWEPTAPRVRGWYTLRGPWAYHLELTLPDGYLGPSLAEGEALIRSFRLE